MQILLASILLIAVAIDSVVSSPIPVNSPVQKGATLTRGTRLAVGSNSKLPPVAAARDVNQRTVGSLRLPSARSDPGSTSRGEQMMVRTPKVKIRLPRTKAGPNDEVNKAYHGPSSSSSSRVPIPETQRGGKANRKAQFEQVWNDLNLHTEMDPVVLANKVLTMRGHGLNAVSSATLASRAVKAKGDPEYETRYLARMAKLSSRYSLEMGIIKKSKYLSNLDPAKQIDIALKETFKVKDMTDKKRKRTSDQIAYRPEAVTNIEMVGKVVQDHLKEKKLDFYQMPLRDLMRETEGLGIHGMEPRHFTNSLYRFIEHHRDDKDVELDAARRERKNALRRGKKKVKVASQDE